MENILVQQQINELFASYRKSLSKLFTDYSATKEFDKLEKFDNYKPLKNRMNAGETVRFLRDHSISELFVIPDEVVMIIREVNSILCTPQEECHYLTFTGLEQFILQLAVHISRKFFYKRRKCKTLVEVIERVIKRMGIEKDFKEISIEKRSFAIRPLKLDLINKNKSVSPLRK